MCAVAYSAHLRCDMNNEAIFHQLLNKCLALVQRSLTNQTPTEYCPKRNAKKTMRLRDATGSRNFSRSSTIMIFHQTFPDSRKKNVVSI